MYSTYRLYIQLSIALFFCLGLCVTQDSEDCTGNGADYRGSVSTTVSGRTCQPWLSQSPHSHTRTPQNYPGSGLDGNLCRNPDGEAWPWCYTLDPSVRFEQCPVECDQVAPLIVPGTYRDAERGYNYRDHPAYGSADFVLIIGVDGFGSWFLSDDLGAGDFPAPGNFSSPVLDQWELDGAHTFFARALIPTISKPVWMGIIAGAGPSKTGVLSNGWLPGRELEPVSGRNSYFPSVFQAVKDQDETMRTAAYTDWAGFNEMFPTSIVDEVVFTSTASMTDRVINELIFPTRTELMILHYDDMDLAGHTQGWGGQRWFDVLMEQDRRIGELLKALDTAQIGSRTLVMIVADHGGIGTSHGGSSAEELYTPFFLRGPMVKQNYQIPCPNVGFSCYEAGSKTVRQMDAPSTALFALGLDQPDIWIGRPILEAFEE